MGTGDVVVGEQGGKVVLRGTVVGPLGALVGRDGMLVVLPGPGTVVVLPGLPGKLVVVVGLPGRLVVVVGLPATLVVVVILTVVDGPAVEVGPVVEQPSLWRRDVKA